MRMFRILPVLCASAPTPDWPRPRVLVALALMLLASSLARAGESETEKRLKIAGVEETLRKRINLSIDKGVKYLVANQEAEGCFSADAAGLLANSDTVTPLCALALRHAATPTSTKAARQAIEFILKPVANELLVMHHTYLAGITAMLLQADGGSNHDAIATCASKLANSLDPETGWWGYYTDVVNAPNLSTSQFAALGLWAGRMAGAGEARGVWRRHLLALCRSQSGGSWPYMESTACYPTGTFMGLANLLLAREALAEEISKDPRLSGIVRHAVRKGLRALHRDGARVLRGLEKGGYPFYFYNLYALEKACVFADIEKLGTGKIRWYEAGAKVLLHIQNEDGGWGWEHESLDSNLPGAGKLGGGVRVKKRKSDLVQTSFALLFLLRSSQAYHPVTPRTVGATASPATEEPGESNKPAEGGLER